MEEYVLLTGGAGFIGSHTAVELLDAGRKIIIADDLSNSEASVIGRIEKITGKAPLFFEIDVADKTALRKLFSEYKICAVIHFAGFKAVGESVLQPVKYYRNNLDTTISLLEVMSEFGCKNLIFSSSATVYGNNKVPLTEDMPVGSCTNPYGKTKFFIEEMLKDAAHAGIINAAVLRYFNPIGAHPSGLIGEKPNGIPNNLLPYITQTAAGIRKELPVYGDDYETPDGTGVRDFIHVVDLAKGHLKALEWLENCPAAENRAAGISDASQSGVWEAFNLGTGIGYSVLDVIKAFEKANGVRIPFRIAPRRPGDVASSYADASKALQLLGWQAELDLVEMCRDSWNWQKTQGDGSFVLSGHKGTVLLCSPGDGQYIGNKDKCSQF